MPEVYGFTLSVQDNMIKTINGMDVSLLKLEADSYRATQKIEGHFSTMGSKLKGMFGGIGGLIKGATGIGFLFGGVELAKSSMEAMDKREEAIAKLEAVLKSTGHAAGLTAEELEKMAGAQSGKELFSKSAIMDAQSMLLTFTSVRGKIFDEAMPAISDFATRFKMELPEAANMVGKALNNPLTGMTRLQRQGVVFSEQQKEQIRLFMQEGKVAEAQSVIIKELGVEFGGLSQAMAGTDSGKLKMVTKELTTLKLSIGELIDKGLIALSPAISGIGSFFKELIKGMQGAEEKYKNMRESFTSTQDKIKPLLKQYDELKSKTNLSALEQTNLKTVIGEIGKIVPSAITAFDKYGNALEISTGKVDEFMKRQQVLTAYLNRDALKDVNKQLLELQKEHDNTIADLKNGGDFVQSGTNTFYAKFTDAQIKERQERARKTQENIDQLKEVRKGLSGDYADLVQGAGLKKASGGKGGAGFGLTDNATETSMLGGASGGLGEAKTIKIDFHSPLMQINVPGGNGQDIINKAPLTMEQLLRILNNITLSQGATM